MFYKLKWINIFRKRKKAETLFEISLFGIELLINGVAFAIDVGRSVIAYDLVILLKTVKIVLCQC